MSAVTERLSAIIPGPVDPPSLIHFNHNRITAEVQHRPLALGDQHA
jgi:hypothetical protein